MRPVSAQAAGHLRAGGSSRRVIRTMIGSAAAACTFSNVSALNVSQKTSSQRTASRPPGSRLSVSKRPASLALSVAVASAAVLPALAAGPAVALPRDDKPTASATPAAPGKARNDPPPADMSKVGGDLLGQPDTQVRLGAGAPVLPKDVTGRSWIVADAESGQVLASHNAHWRLPPASTLKMLFADTVLPKFPRDQQHMVTADDLAGMGPGSSLVGVKANLSYSVHDLWLGVFLRSGNDAVHVLSSMNGGVAKTVQDMQAQADELQALDTRVVSPDGYDMPGQVSSAYDLTLFARSGLQNKDFREYCATATAKFPGPEGKDKKRDTVEIQNTNRLLTGDFGLSPYKGIAGVKNGNTTNAGSTFTGVAERDGKVLLVTVMNPASGESQAVYKEAARLLDWGFAANGKVTPVGELVPPKSATTGTGSGSAQGSAKNRTGQAAAAKGQSGGIGVALGVAGGALALVVGAIFLLNRRWPIRKR
ncbi:D-alanyl-D-alanine carboxypeptidase family protein [Streptomyces sp. WM6378]|uniref:D-alanyl-D-alanine carboxypeptidase family protein n=1 Tax=Streptomyces sp. WM6378 TaxID=1415557 RepID=UPI001F2E23B7|nr:D-alanyl-D-alanine carboxypeptidase [Streptomyces sp. WM6378]